MGKQQQREGARITGDSVHSSKMKVKYIYNYSDFLHQLPEPQYELKQCGHRNENKVISKLFSLYSGVLKLIWTFVKMMCLNFLTNEE